MLYKKGMLKKLSAIILAVLCFTALSSIAVLAIDIDGDTWKKVDSSSGENAFSVEDIDFVVIKQAKGAVIWLKNDLNAADREALKSKIGDKDPSILNSTSDGIVFTTDRDFILKEVLNYTGSGGKYDARVTVSTVSGKLTMTIDGAYSHYCYGKFVKETTTAVTTTTAATTTTPPYTDETTAPAETTRETTAVFTTTEPPFTDETTTAIETTTEETAVFTTSEPPFTNETTAPTETTRETTAVFTTSEPPFTDETSTPAETTTETTAVFTTSEPPFTDETSTPAETTTETTAVFTTSEPPLTNETSVTAITDPNPPYTGADSGIGSAKAIITAIALFGSLSGIAVLLYAIRKSGSK